VPAGSLADDPWGLLLSCNIDHAHAIVFCNKISNVNFSWRYTPNVILMFLLHLFSESCIINVKKHDSKNCKIVTNSRYVKFHINILCLFMHLKSF